MHKVVINDIDLSQEFIISENKYPIYSQSNIYRESADNISSFYKVTDNSKPVTFTLVKKEQCMDSITLQQYIEVFVATKLKTKEPTWIEVDGRYMYAILDSVVDSEMYRGEVTLTFMNLPGKWYGPEKTEKITSGLSPSFQVKGIAETNMIKIIVRPKATTVTLKHNDNQIIVRNAMTSTDLIIDNYNKRVTQNNDFSEIDIESNFFNFTKGQNTVTIKNADGEIKYREVIAL